MLLRDYAITPDVFDETSYAHPSACDAELRFLKEVLLSEALIRDLRMGEWFQVFRSGGRPWHRRGKELLKKLITQDRLIPFPSNLVSTPPDDRTWCQEALLTSNRLPFTGGIIVTEATKASFPAEVLVAEIHKLSSAPWWASRSPSVTLARTLGAYTTHLATILRCANSLMFIDPHINPQRPGYADFAQLITAAGNRVPAPAIEIHRVCYEGSGVNRIIVNPQDLEGQFRSALQTTIHAAGLRVEVFIWDDFHDRHLIANFIGISLPNGFDTSADATAVTRWTRLGRTDSDDIQREFDPASGRHTVRYQFSL